MTTKVWWHFMDCQWLTKRHTWQQELVSIYTKDKNTPGQPYEPKCRSNCLNKDMPMSNMMINVFSEKFMRHRNCCVECYFIKKKKKEMLTGIFWEITKCFYHTHPISSALSLFSTFQLLQPHAHVWYKNTNEKYEYPSNSGNRNWGVYSLIFHMFDIFHNLHFKIIL